MISSTANGTMPTFDVVQTVGPNPLNLRTNWIMVFHSIDTGLGNDIKLHELASGHFSQCWDRSRSESSIQPTKHPSTTHSQSSHLPSTHRPQLESRSHRGRFIYTIWTHSNSQQRWMHPAQTWCWVSASLIRRRVGWYGPPTYKTVCCCGTLAQRLSCTHSRHQHRCCRLISMRVILC